MNKCICAAKIKKSLFIVPAILFIISLILVACQKEKTAPSEAQGPVGTCEILANLPQDVKKPIEVNFGNRIKLKGVTVDIQSEEKLQVSYYWEPMDALEAYNTVFVHFTDKEDNALFQNDHSFCPQEPFEKLKGKIVKETFDVFFPKTAAGQEITLKIGLYDPKFAGRLQIESTGGLSADDDDTRAIVETIIL
jgi:hypothetical protein